MIALDTDLLVYAHRPEAPLHEAARRRVAELHEARRPWGVPIHCLVEFAAVVSKWTVDRDYSRFPGLTVRNPLVAGA